MQMDLDVYFIQFTSEVSAQNLDHHSKTHQLKNSQRLLSFEFYI